jgi:hypothetical protein
MDIAISYFSTCTTRGMVAGYTHTPFITNKLIIAEPNLLLLYFTLVENPLWKTLAEHLLKRARLGSRGPN